MPPEMKKYGLGLLLSGALGLSLVGRVGAAAVLVLVLVLVVVLV